MAPVNPLTDEHGRFHVVVNDEEQYALWPTFATVPAGWRIAFGPAGHRQCLDYTEENWLDLRPKSARTRPSDDGRARLTSAFKRYSIEMTNDTPICHS